MNQNNYNHRFLSEIERVEFVDMTPAMARNILRGNRGNRRVRAQWVETLKQAFLRGEYKTSHQGVALSRGGRVLDGQHRLTAIADMPNSMTFRMLVTYGLSEDVYDVIDIGAKRTASDALQHEDPRVVELASLIASICLSSGRATPALLVPIVEAVRAKHAALIAAAPAPRRTWSSAPVRLAAVMCMLSGADQDFVTAQYRALVLQDYSVMAPAAQALAKRVNTGNLSVSGTGRNDVLSVCLTAFDPSKASASKVVSKPQNALQRVRGTFSHLIPKVDVPKKEAAIAAALSDSVSDYGSFTADTASGISHYQDRFPM